ncbi:MAG: alpha/beta hydrolase family protein [Amphritea sp.]|nr:alpha/beta hydrolase family protein [Amphritea sp.]
MKAIAQFLLSTTLLLPLYTHAADGDPATAETTTADTAADSSSTMADKPEPVTADLLEQQRQADIATAQAPETEVFWLDAGEQQRLALYLASVEPEAHAGIIIFPDTTTSADWPDLIHPLRTTLTEHGWSTLTLNLPPEAGIRIPERTLPARLDSSTLQTETGAEEGSAEQEATASTEAATDTAENTDKNNQPTDPETASTGAENKPLYADLVTELSAAAGQIIIEKGHEKLVVMGIGNGAVWATRLFMAGDADNQYLVLIDPHDSNAPDTPTLVSMISQLEAPALDLWFDNTPYARQSAALRKRTAQRNKATDYTQIRINRRFDATGKQPQWLTKQVRGILESRILKQMQSPAVNTAPENQITPGA